LRDETVEIASGTVLSINSHLRGPYPASAIKCGDYI